VIESSVHAKGVERLGRRRWSKLWPGVCLLAAASGVVVFLALVVAPSAGAAGGCGGG
jgi:hypothetical protein